MMIGVAAAAAQVPELRPAVFITEVRTSVIVGTAGSPAVVIERLMSFDRNADDRITSAELPERMQGLVARGDKNADGALDSEEIRSVVHVAASSQPIHGVSRPPASEGLRGVISDLKLPSAKHLRALLIVGAHTTPGNINDPASSALREDMKALLDDEEYENFLAAATRLSSGRRIGFGGVVRRTPSGR
jgi:hypothetical protein